MIWQQAGISFLVWIAHGLLLRRQSERMLLRFLGMSLRKRVMLGSVGLIASAIILIASLFVISNRGGMTENGLTLWAWLLITLIGLLFVHMQVLGAAAMISLIQGNDRLYLERESKDVLHD